MIGSEGTLGLDLRGDAAPAPDPRGDRRGAVHVPHDRRRGAVRGPRRPVRDPRQPDRARRREPDRRHQPPLRDLLRRRADALFLEFDGGSRDEVEAQARETAEIAAELGGSEFAWATDEARAPEAVARPPRRLWRPRGRCSPGSGALTTDVCVPVSALAECIAETQADIAEHGLTASIVGHVGDGNFHAVILVDPADPADVARGEDVPRPPGPPRARSRRDLHRRARRRLRQGQVPRRRARRGRRRDDAGDQARARPRRDLQPRQDRLGRLTPVTV